MLNEKYVINAPKPTYYVKEKYIVLVIINIYKYEYVQTMHYTDVRNYGSY